MDNDINELEDIRKNIVDWYPFEKDKKVLDLSNRKYITDLLRKKCCVVTESEKNEKYDYIVFVGNIGEGAEKIKNSLKHLDDDGKLLLAANNGLSIKSLCVDYDDTNLSKNEIDHFLSKNGLEFKKTYYVYPSIEAANVLYTDKFTINPENISRNIFLYENDEIAMQNENTLIKKFLKKDKSVISLFSNAFFFECSKKSFIDNEIYFVSYTNMRKTPYRVKTIIQGKYAVKTAWSEKSQTHIQQIEKNIDYMNLMGIETVDKYEDSAIKSKIMYSETVDQIVINKFENNQPEEARNIVKKFSENLFEKLTNPGHVDKNVFDKYDIEYATEDIENLHFAKYGLWDLIFQNAFLIDDKIIFFDQEWYEENVPVEFILYRSYKYTTKISKYISLEEFYSLLNVNSNMVKIFEQLDSILQDNVRSEIIWKLHSNHKSYSNIIDNANRKNEELSNNINIITEDFKKLLNEKDARIRFLEDNIQNNCQLIQEREIQLAQIQGSRSWKLTKPLRRLEKFLKKGKNNENKR